MTEKEIMESADRTLIHVYNRFPVVFDHGDGVRLYSAGGKEYLDFASGIGVMALGYNVEPYKDALKDQIDRITHISNLFYSEPMEEAAKKLVEISGMDRVFFTNSGAEAIEGAIKTAKKYAYKRDGDAGDEIVAMQNSFHGRTVGALSATGTDHYRTPFYPLMGGVHFAQYNDFDSVKEACDDKTCAILMETVQGEGGIYPADPEFLRKVRALCDERDMLLILDEVQCGMGRTGSYFAWQNYGVKPDIVASAKALGCGVPVGAFLVTEKVASASLEPGDHGSTYGGNPLCCAAVSKVIDIMREKDIPGHVKALAPHFEAGLDELVSSHQSVLKRRGMGFMQGLVIREDVKSAAVVASALENGLVTLSAGGNVLRLLPPLVMTEEDIDEGISILDSTLKNFD